MALTYLEFYIRPILEKPEDFKTHVENLLTNKESTPAIQSQQASVIQTVQTNEFTCLFSLIMIGVLIKNLSFLEKTSNFVLKAGTTTTIKNIVNKIADQFEKFKGLKPLVDLVEFRIKWLEDYLKGDHFSWKMKEAVMPEFPLVEAFLKGSDFEMNFTSYFTSILNARQFVNEHSGINVFKGYSTFMQAYGSGRSSHVKITKTNEIFLKTEKGLYQIEHKKLKDLMSKI